MSIMYLYMIDLLNDLLCIINSYYMQLSLHVSIRFAVPSNVAALDVASVETNSITVKWEAPTDTIFDTFVLSISPGQVPEVSIQQ